jgi:LssY C-terminus
VGRTCRRVVLVGGAAAYALCCAGLPARAQAQGQDSLRPPAVFPAGTHLPIRFLYPLASGRDSVGARVLVQTMGALIQDSCVVVPPFTQVQGRLTISRGGHQFGGPGAIRIAFDSLEVRRGTWVPISAVLDTLEYAPSRDIGPSGTVYGRRVSIGRRLVPAGIASVADVDVIPAALLGGYLIARRGPRATILAGEVGGLRLQAPLRLGVAACSPPAANRDLTTPPALPAFAPRSDTKSGVPWDPINLIFIGTSAGLDTAFAHAGWRPAHAHSTGAVVKEVLAALADRPAVTAPVSTEYFEGRPQDAAFELAGPNARIRHHVRIWLLDSVAGLWVGAATEDVGIIVTKRTHRISPRVDLERDRIVRDLEAGGCADLVQYVRLPGAVTRARTPEGQRMLSDGRAAIVRLEACDPR